MQLNAPYVPDESGHSFGRVLTGGFQPRQCTDLPPSALIGPVPRTRRTGKGSRRGWRCTVGEQVKFPPFPGDRDPSSANTLPDLPSDRCLPAGQPQRGPDRALPPGPSRSTRPPCPVAGPTDRHHLPVCVASRADRTRPSMRVGGGQRWVVGVHLLTLQKTGSADDPGTVHSAAVQRLAPMLDVTVPESPSGAPIATTGSPTFTDDDGPSEITLSWWGVCTAPRLGSARPPHLSSRLWLGIGLRTDDSCAHSGAFKII